MKTLFLIFALLFESFAQAAHAQEQPAVAVVASTPTLETLRDHLLYARYDEAIATAVQVLSRTTLTAQERAQTLECLAIAQIATGDHNAAQSTLDTLYRRDPTYRLSDADASPPVQAAFARARESHGPVVEVELHHSTPVLETRETPTLEARVSRGSDAVHTLRFSYKLPGETAFTQALVAPVNGVAHARIPLPDASQNNQGVDYYIEALAPSLAVLATLGTQTDPLRLRIPNARAQTADNDDDMRAVPLIPTEHAVDEQPSGSIASKWWFWTIIVVGAGAIATGVSLGVMSQQSGETPMGTLGTITLQ